MNLQLPAKYAAARRALAAASNVDEVLKIRNLNLAAEVYAFQAKDRELMAHAVEMRARAERRLSEIHAKQPKANGSEFGGRKSKLGGFRAIPPNPPKTLIQQGIDKNLATRMRRAGAMSDAAFEKDVARRVSHAMKSVDGTSKDPTAERGQPSRDGPDFWPTPDSLIAAAHLHMLPVVCGRGPIWECAAGDGRLGHGIGAKVMTDKYPQNGSRSRPLDFLTDDPPTSGLLAFTNPPFNAADEFLTRGMQLLDRGAIRGLVLLLRHDHFMAAGKVAALNRATFELHCNWRPTWIPDTDGSPRWAFAWVYWGKGKRLPPLYVQETP